VGYCTFELTDRGKNRSRKDESDLAGSSSLELRPQTLYPPKEEVKEEVISKF